MVTKKEIESIRPAFWDGNNLVSKLLGGGENAIADLLPLDIKSLSAGDENILMFREDFVAVNKKFLSDGKQVVIINEVVSVTPDVSGDGMQTIARIARKDMTTLFFNNMNRDDSKSDEDLIKDGTTFYVKSQLYKPVYWLEITDKELDMQKRMLETMGENVFLRVDARTSEGSGNAFIKKVKEYELDHIEENLRDGQRMFVSSEPYQSLGKAITSQGFGEGIPGMPGVTGSVRVRKPSNSSDDFSPEAFYTSGGKDWWGSNEES